VGRMEPGDIFDTEAGRGPRSLAAALTRRAAVKDRDRAERWDATSADVGRILELAGLHAAAGGPGYTGLDAGRLGRLDLSPLVAGDRAVLVGTAPAGTRLTATLLRQPMQVDVFDTAVFEAVGRQSLALALVFIGGITISLLPVATQCILLRSIVWTSVSNASGEYLASMSQRTPCCGSFSISPPTTASSVWRP